MLRLLPCKGTQVRADWLQRAAGVREGDDDGAEASRTHLLKHGESRPQLVKKDKNKKQAGK